MAEQLEYMVKTQDENKNILTNNEGISIKQEVEENFFDYINSSNRTYQCFIKNETIDIKPELTEDEQDSQFYESLHQSDSEIKEEPESQDSSASDEKFHFCDKCEFRSKYPGNLRKHKYVHTNIRQFGCDLCSYSTSRSDNLKKHKINMHLKKQPNTNFKSKSDILIVREFVYSCQLCDFRTDHEYVLDQHMFTHGDPESVKKYKCQLCTYQTNKKENYKMHTITHNTTKDVVKFKCPLCDHQSTRKSNLRQHMMTHKSSQEVQMYKCDSCPFESKYKKSLTKHVIRHRTDAQKQWYECEICSFRTFTKYSLKPHMLLHQTSEDGAFECEYCGKTFAARKHLNYHMRKHKKKKFICGVCNYVTKSDDDINEHMLIHELDNN